MEELLTEILIEIKGLKAGQAVMQSDITAMQGDIKGLKAGQIAMQDEIKSLKDGQIAMQTDIIVMRADIKDLKDGQAAIHAEIKNLKESDAAILDMLEKTYRKVEAVEDNQDRMSESTRYLMRQGVQHEEDIKRIRKAL
ncbi:hypothetical protein [Sporomusa sphaeroides]|uniref:hypothetical protein n=1 Tax=Sporomusa sphaeroides TaxID=47679 RepID=UPI002B641F5A|nr:hypothetical protein [Sporomusa sphaeroides]HML34224.1 hypothetical protein [Sporomusa sphaeroides]